MTTSNGLAVLVDNTDPTFVYNQQWSPPLGEPIWFGGTYTYSVVGQENATLSCIFQGTSMTFFGHADGQMASTVDGGGSVYNPPTLFSQTYQPWFNSGELPDGQHAISLSFGTRVYFDYAAIIAGQATPLRGRSIMVDDRHPAMNYTGHWETLGDQKFATGDGLEQTAQGMTVSQSRNVGDHVVFLFTGSSVSVYGVVQWQIAGRVSTAYIIDGSEPQTVTIDSESGGHRYTNQPNYLFFHADLSPGNHTLVITVTDVTEEQLFTLDYVVYNASFDNLATMPSLTSSDTHSWTTPPLIYPKKMVPIGAIVGGVVGGVALLCLAALLVWWRKCRRKGATPSDRREEIDPSPEPAEPPAYSPQTTFRPTSHSYFSGSVTTDRSPQASTGAPSTYHPSPPPDAVPHFPVYVSCSHPSFHGSETPSTRSLDPVSPSHTHADHKVASYHPHQPRHVSRSSIAKSEQGGNTPLSSPTSPAYGYPSHMLGENEPN